MTRSRVAARGWLVVAALSSGHPDPVAARQDTLTVIPGPQYEAGALHRFLLGDHYRELWTEPLRVPVLDLDRFAGGLTALCRGGGFQTKSIRFRGADDREYVFRSVDKNPTARLPVMLRETFIADVLQDQISSHHPGGALVLPPLLDATGILNAEPHLRVMPDDSALGQYRAAYAGMLGLIEERPQEGPDDTEGFGGSREVRGTDDIWERIEDSPEHQVNARAFLAARLMDMFIGDWDRHYDQWRWARFPSENGYTWHPIPRDRDQAFSRLDGLILSIGKQYIPGLVSFGNSFGRIADLVWTGRAIDRRFLSELAKPTWDSVVTALQTRLTDAVIDSAVQRLPPEMYVRNAERLTTALKRRRDRLPRAAEAFYALLANQVDIEATDEDEIALIDRLDDSRVQLRIYHAEEGETPSGGSPYFDRVFDREETSEIRLYLHGGDDHAIVRGRVNAGLLVRIIGGGGDDEMTDSSFVSAGARTKFYDARGENRFQRGLQTSLNRRRFRPPPATIIEAGEWEPGVCGDSISEPAPRDLAVPFRDWGRQWFPAPWLSYQPDLGLFIGGGAIRTGYGFRRVPYKSHQAFRVGIATQPGRFRFEYEGDFRGQSLQPDAALLLRYSGIDIIRFHGFGNETTLDLPDIQYQASLEHAALAPSIVWRPTPSIRLSLGPRLSYVETQLGTGNLVDSLRPYGVDGLAQLGVQATVDVDTRDITVAPTRGIHLQFAGRLTPAWLDIDGPFGSLSAELSSYLTARAFPLRPTLALRVAGKRVWGTYPFYEAAYLGGNYGLRGFHEQRFAGDASLFGNAELRLFLSRYRFVLPGEFGIFGLTDVGRVFLDGESSDTWHTSGGGGIWFAFIEPGATMSVAVAKGARMGLYIRAGFAY